MTRLCTDVLVVSTGTPEKQANLPKRTMIIGNMVARSYTYAGALPVPCITALYSPAPSRLGIPQARTAARQISRLIRVPLAN